ncbi:MAG: hypothetical protein AAFO96_21470 [Bacteroidota bacterium]
MHTYQRKSSKLQSRVVAKLSPQVLRFSMHPSDIFEQGLDQDHADLKAEASEGEEGWGKGNNYIRLTIGKTVVGDQVADVKKQTATQVYIRDFQSTERRWFCRAIH